MSVGDRDDFVRRYELERVERAVEGLRDQMRQDAQRGADLREADQRVQLAEHRSLEERITREAEQHEREHEAELKALKTDRQWTWNRTLAVITAACAVVGAYYLILSHSH